MSPESPPLFLVCEDGDEYTRRFERFLGREFRFCRVSAGHQAEAAVRREGPAGLLLDLDFRRLAPEDLWGEAGPSPHPPSTDERARWSAVQGILILQHLRSLGIGVPALLFADLDDREQAAYLEKTLAPLSVVSSREGMAQLGTRLHAAPFSAASPSRPRRAE